jgi:hypothetical protein
MLFMSDPFIATYLIETPQPVEFAVMALEFLAPAATGPSLCRIHASSSALDRCALICKGGQMDPDSFLLDLVSRGAAPAQRRPRNLRQTSKPLKPARNVS